MATVAEIASGIADVAENVIGLRAFDYVPDSINPPAAILILGEITEETFGYGSMEVPFDLVVLVSRTTARVGQGSLYEYASHTGDKSLWLAIANNKSLGLAGVNARIVRYRPLGIEEIAAYGYFGGAFEMIVTT
ncbi:MAG TPA: hypothetical protein VK481_09535 [Gemmatimonadaceae bacterium]|nr:hypothetical protein [Gemmatimonadaceae bacterium]